VVVLYYHQYYTN